jgi:small GTP-binding protein
MKNNRKKKERTSTIEGSLLAETKKYTYKLVVVGDPSVGKTSLIRRYADKKFDESYLPTIGADFTIKQIDLEEDNIVRQIMLTIWDMGGHVGFQRIRDLYYPGANVSLVVFDLTVRETFEHVESWLEDVKSHCGEDIPVIVLANKNDLPDRAVSQDEIDAFASNKSVKIFETSAKTGENIENVFELIAKLCYESYDTRSESDEER